MSDSVTGRAGPGRPRNPETHRAILEAVAALLARGGCGAVSMEAVAAQAGVGKQTIYRWWPTKANLVLEYLVAYAAEIRLPDEGNLLADLRAYLMGTLTS